MSEWQPIETAPKDGSEILVCEPGRTMAVVFWRGKSQVMYGEERQVYPDIDGSLDDYEIFVVGWYMSDGKNAPIWYRNWPSLKHWMLLPPSPPH